MKDLDELRGQWERGAIMYHGGNKDLNFALTIIGRGHEFDCFRYFTIGADWQVSVDKSSCDLEQAFAWLASFNDLS